MATISITEAAFAGLGLLGRRPISALVWALLYVLFLGFIVVVFGTGLVNTISTFAKQGPAQPSMPQVLNLIGGLIGMYFVMLIGLIILGGVVSCAVFRSVLEPDRSAFFSLRLGRAELWVMLVGLVQWVLMFAIQMLILIPVTMLTLMTVAISHQSQVMVLVTIIARVAMYALMLWIYVRFSLAAPMSYYERKFRLFESWTLTRGHAWPIFAVGILVFIISMVAYVILAVLGVAGGVGLWAVVPHPISLQALGGQTPAALMRMFEPLLGFVLVMLLIGGAILTPILLAPWAQIYRRLRPDVDVAATFV